MGKIDLDPASCPLANQVVQATTIYTSEQDGLLLPFYGCIWMNPPYGTRKGKSNAGLWIKRLIYGYTHKEIEQAIALVNADTSTRWFHQLWDYQLCFTLGRINFYTGRTQARYAGTHGSVFVYLGEHIDRFTTHFSPFGHIVLP